MARLLLSLQSLLLGCDGHGHMTFPPNRAGGNLSVAGLNDYNLDREPSMWFSQPALIPGEPTLNDVRYRTYNVDVRDGPKDWTRKMPWRAPGKAPVRGSGCGVAGGAHVMVPNGGHAPSGWAMGTDGMELPEAEVTEWTIGGVAEVGFALVANHAGGYSWRLCKKSDGITEECFQKTTLPFHGNGSWLRYADVFISRDNKGPLKFPDVHIPRVVVPGDQVFPLGSHWARNPVPLCKYCDPNTCGSVLMNLSERVTVPPMDRYPDDQAQYGGNEWYVQESCLTQCAGQNLMQCPPGMTQFAEPAAGVSGYMGNFAIMQSWADYVDPDVSTLTAGLMGFSYSIMDEVKVPSHLEEGDYVLSWRWDCEATPQIWQQCADIKLVKPTVVV